MTSLLFQREAAKINENKKCLQKDWVEDITGNVLLYYAQ